MRRILLALPLLLLWTAIPTGGPILEAQPSGAEDAPATPDASGDAAPTTPLAWDWTAVAATEAGALFYEIREQSSRTLTIADGESQQSRTTLTRWIRLRPILPTEPAEGDDEGAGEPDEAEAVPGSVRVEAIVVAASLQFDNPAADWDSRDPDAEGRADEAMVRPTAVIVGEPLILHIAPTGEIFRVEGYEAIVADMLADLRRDPEDRAMADGIASTMTESAFAVEVETMLGRLPKDPVPTNAAWETTYKQPLKGIGSLNGKTTWSFVGLDLRDGRDVARIRRETQVTIEPTGEDAAGEFMGLEVIIARSGGNYDGELQFDPTAGWLQSAEHEGGIEIQLTFPREEIEATSRMTSTTTIQRLDPETFAARTADRQPEDGENGADGNGR